MAKRASRNSRSSLFEVVLAVACISANKVVQVTWSYGTALEDVT